jgi:hypothetical protein
MCDDFDKFQQRERYTLNLKVRDPAQVTLLYGLNAHAHYMVKRCLPILAESTIAAIPIVRSVFECGVMAQWLRFVPGSEMTLMDEFDGHMRRVIDDLESSAEPNWRERAAELRGRSYGDSRPIGSTACLPDENSTDLRVLLRRY